MMPEDGIEQISQHDAIFLGAIGLPLEAVGLILAVDRVLDMCLRLEAEAYLFGAHGQEYADPEVFSRAGVRVGFQDYRHPVYPQLYEPFTPHLSVVDLLFHCGPESRTILLKDQPDPFG